MIPFNKPYVVGKEFEYIQQAVDNLHLSGDGPFTKRCEALLEQELGVPRALLTTSCTHALEMAALLLDIKPGDEVIIPSFTFVSTVNAFVLRGARPVFIDTPSCEQREACREESRHGTHECVRHFTAVCICLFLALAPRLQAPGKVHPQATIEDGATTISSTIRMSDPDQPCN